MIFLIRLPAAILEYWFGSQDHTLLQPYEYLKFLSDNIWKTRYDLRKEIEETLTCRLSPSNMNFALRRLRKEGLLESKRIPDVGRKRPGFLLTPQGASLRQTRLR